MNINNSFSLANVHGISGIKDFNALRGGVCPGRRALKPFNARLAVDYPLPLLYIQYYHVWSFCFMCLHFLGYPLLTM